MKLFYSLTSPFARKVRAVVQERGLINRINAVSVDPWSDESLRMQNPLCQVPALELDNGTTLFDSPVICEYLDTLAGPLLYPPAGDARWTALRLQALSDGICNAAIRRRLELNRPEAQRSNSFMERQRRAIDAALDSLEQGTLTDDETVTIGQIALGCALGYLDLRFPKEDWRSKRPALASWFKRFSTRPTMLATAPPTG